MNAIRCHVAHLIRMFLLAVSLFPGVNVIVLYAWYNRLVYSCCIPACHLHFYQPAHMALSHTSRVLNLLLGSKVNSSVCHVPSQLVSRS